MKKLTNFILIILTLGIILIPRFSQLGTTPPGLHIDEASFAADAKALAETGRDTWNKSFPLVFKAFGEWKAPGLTYSMAFWTKILGRMDNFVARLPSALAGVFILSIFFLTLRLLYPKTPIWTGLVAVFLLAFSPWHFAMSRIFYEAFSALALISLAIYFYSRELIYPTKNNKYLWLGSIAASLAGYYYASVRYIILLASAIIPLLKPGDIKNKIKSSSLILIIVALVGVGWVGDLFSSRGLTRLRFYESKAQIGATLQVDEKRQFCGLNFGINSPITRTCYYLWNKPIDKAFSAASVILSYLSPTTLFWHAEVEYGIDAEYGYFLLPLLPLYLIGLYTLVKASIGKDKLNSFARFYFVLLLISLIPAALAGEVNARFGVIPLYLHSLAIGIGLYQFMFYIKSSLPKLASLSLILLFSFSLIFFILQSLMHYFAVYTKSNDWVWTSDSASIFNYVKSVSKDYDLIIDADLHGPLAPYFYGDLTTYEIQNSKHTPEDAMGWTFIESAGKYLARKGNIIDFACEKLGRGDKRRTLVITPKVESLVDIRRYTAYSWNKVNIMHEVYDLDEVVAHEVRVNPSFRATCTPK